MNFIKYIIIYLLDWTGRLFHGPHYTIDRNIPLTSMIGVGMRRLAALIRGVARGIALVPNPRKLVFIGPDVILRNRLLISFGNGVSVGKGVIIDGLSHEGVVLDDLVSIGPYSIIEGTGVITALGKGVKIGTNSGIGAYSFIGGAGGVVIGRNVIMGQRVSFHSENHICDRTDVPIRLQGVTRKGIIIEDDCWIGANVTLLDGARVGTGCVIGANSLVTCDIPPFSVAVGIPAQVIRNRK